MPRISSASAHTLRARAHSLRDAGLSLRQIQVELGLKSVASVQNYLSREPGLDPGPALVEALRLKATTAKHQGPLQIKASLEVQGHVLPSENTLGRHFAAAGLARRGLPRLASRQPYWVDARLTAPLQQIQLDTVKVRTPDGILNELLTARDAFSGATLLQVHNPTQLGMVDAVARVFAAFGVPDTIQCDNGTADFSMHSRHMLRPWHLLAFSRGVKRIQFIPEAEPQRNGSVESFHNWLQTEWSNHGQFNCPTAADLPAWLSDRLHYYNYVKPLTSLGGKADRRTPASVHPGFDLSAAVLPVDASYDLAATGTISFIRRVLHCLTAVVKAPATVFAMPPQLEGHYCRFDLDTVTGAGSVWTHNPVDVSSVSTPV